MKALTCEMCGSTNLIKDGGVFVCQSCGTKYSVEEAKKMMIEGTVDITGSVKIDSSDELKNLFELAHRAKEMNNNESACQYYKKILLKDPSSWEANYYVEYYRIIECKNDEIQSASKYICGCLDIVLYLIRGKISNKEEQKIALNEILLSISFITTNIIEKARSGYVGDKVAITREAYISKHIATTANICYIYGNTIIQHFENEYSELAVESWKMGVGIHEACLKYSPYLSQNLEIIQKYGNKIREYDPSYIIPDKKGCYIATAVYGSYDCPEVWILRRFRDYTLAETWYGRLFIKIYYATSPTLVKHFGNSIWFKKLFASPINKLVKHLRNKGVECTPYKDKIFK